MMGTYKMQVMHKFVLVLFQLQKGYLEEGLFFRGILAEGILAKRG
jgi:hypothetical protein